MVSQRKKKSKLFNAIHPTFAVRNWRYMGVSVVITSDHNTSHLSTRRHCQEGEEFPIEKWLVSCNEKWAEMI